MRIKDIYDLLTEVKILCYSSNGKEEIHAPSLHLKGYDETGIYFSTMWNKPFYSDLTQSERIIITGFIPDEQEKHSEFYTESFLRLVGSVKHLNNQEVKLLNQKWTDDLSEESSSYFKIFTARGGLFNHSYDMKDKDFGKYNKKFIYGKKSQVKVNRLIRETCTGCHTCIDVCTFAVDKYDDKIDENLCRGCGSCMVVCPTMAIEVF